MPDAQDVGLPGVLLFPLTPHMDERGSVTEMFRRAWIPGRSEMVQANLSLSRAGVLRGLHFHREQADYWCVLEGLAFIAMADLRAGSPAERRTAEVRIDAGKQRQGLYIPPGVAHGFYAETELMLQYLVDREFTGTDEFVVAWDDPELAIAWPTVDPILSERDRSNPPLAVARGHSPPFWPTEAPTRDPEAI